MLLTINECERMFRQHYSFLCLVAFNITKNTAIAEDLVQDFYLAVWQKRNDLGSISSFQNYAVKAVKNRAISYLRAVSKEPINDVQVLSESTNPLEEKEKMQDLQKTTLKIRSLIDQLPEARKKIFLLHVEENLTYTQIAAKHNISINTVKTQMKRAYAFVREKLADDPLGIVLLAIWMK